MLLNCGVGEDSWESLGLQGDPSWVFTGRTDAEAENPILWPPDVKNWPIGKDPDAGKDRRQEEKGTIEDEMVGWHHWLERHGFEHTPGVGDGQGSLACCSPWGHKESDTTEQLNWLADWVWVQWSLRSLQVLKALGLYWIMVKHLDSNPGHVPLDKLTSASLSLLIYEIEIVVLLPRELLWRSND